MVSTPFLLVMVIMMGAMLAMMVVYAASYKKVPPNEAMVLYRGKREKGEEPHRIGLMLDWSALAGSIASRPTKAS